MVKMTCKWGHAKCSKLEDHNQLFADLVEREKLVESRRQVTKVMELEACKPEVTTAVTVPSDTLKVSETLVTAPSQVGRQDDGGVKGKELSSEPLRIRVHAKNRMQFKEGGVQPNFVLFKSEDHPLSNLYQHGRCGGICMIYYRGFWFSTSEHAYQFEKARRHGHFGLCWAILDHWAGVEAVRDVMKAGQSLKTTPLWKRVKRDVMNELMISKHQFCVGYRNFLENSGDAHLREDTYGYFWGYKTHKNATEKSQNQLGKIHMERREWSRINLLQYGPAHPDPRFRPITEGVKPYTSFRQLPPLRCNVPDDVLYRLEGGSGEW